MDDKLLTIVVPAYNVQKYVRQCLESLVHQSCRRFDVIIVDDGSKDEHTSEICREYAQRYPELIQYVHQENKGLGAARNTGLRMVKTPYVSFLDSDDWMCTRFVERLAEELEKYNDDGIDIVFTMPIIYDSLIGQMTDWMDKPLFDCIFPLTARVVDMGIEKRIYGLEANACRRVFRTAFLRKCHFEFPEGTRWEDVYPHFYLLTHARKCMGIPDVGFYYRTNVPTSITAGGGRSRLEVVTVFQKTLDYLRSGGYDMEIVKYALKMYTSFAIWSMDVVKDSVRKELTDGLHGLYQSIPQSDIDAFLNTEYMINPEQKRFVRLMRGRHYKLYYNYQKEALANLLLTKIGH